MFRARMPLLGACLAAPFLAACGPAATGGRAARVVVPPTLRPTPAVWAPAAPASAPAPAPRNRGPFVRFTDATPGSGLESFELHAGPAGEKNWVVETAGGGVVAADFDGDGDLDLCLLDGAALDATGEVVFPAGAGTRIYRSDGAMRFADVTAASGVSAAGYALGGAAADWDGDGDADLCVAGYGVLRLYRNRGDGTFEDATREAAVVARPEDCLTAAAWGDVDGDGRLDLFLSNYVDQRRFVAEVRAGRAARSCRSPHGRTTYCGPRGLQARPNRLLLQRDGGRFEDVSATHLREPARPAYQAVLSDLDDDGDLDAYVANDGVENSLLVNDGRGGLEDRGVEAGCATSVHADPQGSMGVAVADFDCDGRLDVAVTNLAHEYNALYRNAMRAPPRLRFADVTSAARFSDAMQVRVCWGVGLQDLDGDSYADLFTVAGHVYAETEVVAEHLEQRPEVRRNLGPPDYAFEDVTEAAGEALRSARCWRGAAFGDFDGDGDVDVVATAQGGPPAILRNDGGDRNAWVRFDLRGRGGTPAGARVTVTLPDGTRRTAEVHCGSSFAGSDDPRLTFGLGDAAILPRAEIRWPGERTPSVVLERVPVRTTHVVRQ